MTAKLIGTSTVLFAEIALWHEPFAAVMRKTGFLSAVTASCARGSMAQRVLGARFNQKVGPWNAASVSNMRARHANKAHVGAHIRARTRTGTRLRIVGRAWRPRRERRRDGLHLLVEREQRAVGASLIADRLAKCANRRACTSVRFSLSLSLSLSLSPCVCVCARVRACVYVRRRTHVREGMRASAHTGHVGTVEAAQDFAIAAADTGRASAGVGDLRVVRSARE